MIRKRYHQNWLFQSPGAILTCSILKCGEQSFLAFGGHNKTLYLMDKDLTIIDQVQFDGWCRCSYTIDLDGDNCDEILVGVGDGHFLVLKLDIEQKKLIGILHYKSEGKVTCCLAGDFYRDGDIELIFGGEDRTLKIFKNVYSEEPILIFYYDSWVTACSIGYLKIPKSNIPIYGLLVGTKKGIIQLICMKDNRPEILWQRDLGSQINAIEIADVKNDGYHEIIVCCDDSYVKILDSEGIRLRYIKIENSRPVSILIEDIDGDNAKEILIGCADGSLFVYENPDLDSIKFRLKWKMKVSTSIKNICCIEEKEKDSKKIIFGGYDRKLRNIEDFQWGQKPILQIPEKIIIPKIIPKRLKEEVEEPLEIKVVPVNLREYIIKFLEEKRIFITLEVLINYLIELGYSRDEIQNEIELMKNQNIIRYGKIDFPVWCLSGEEIPPPIKAVPEIKIKDIKERIEVKEEPELIKPIEELAPSEIETSLEVAKPAEVKESSEIIEKPEIIEVHEIEEKILKDKKVKEEVPIKNAIISYLQEKKLI
ncbi:MAG: hypothetical protein ACTSQG_03770, partial [Promethearchaeota archaeon]